MKTYKNITGQRFGRLIAIEQSTTRRYGWKCRCDCGNVVVAYLYDLTGGKHRSCGCLQKDVMRQLLTTHGGTGTRAWKAWIKMRRRCLDERDHDYADYGARGIAICQRWVNSFENFFADMGECPAKKSIGRINNDGNYEPSNCRWETQKQQCRNTRRTVYVELDGVRKPLAEWAEIFGVPYRRAAQRHQNNCPPEKLFAEVEPSRQRKSRKLIVSL